MLSRCLKRTSKWIRFHTLLIRTASPENTNKIEKEIYTDLQDTQVERQQIIAARNYIYYSDILWNSKLREEFLEDIVKYCQSALRAVNFQPLYKAYYFSTLALISLESEGNRDNDEKEKILELLNANTQQLQEHFECVTAYFFRSYYFHRRGLSYSQKKSNPLFISDEKSRSHEDDITLQAIKRETEKEYVKISLQCYQDCRDQFLKGIKYEMANNTFNPIGKLAWICFILSELALNSENVIIQQYLPKQQSAENYFSSFPFFQIAHAFQKNGNISRALEYLHVAIWIRSIQTQSSSADHQLKKYKSLKSDLERRLIHLESKSLLPEIPLPQPPVELSHASSPVVIFKTLNESSPLKPKLSAEEKQIKREERRRKARQELQQQIELLEKEKLKKEKEALQQAKLSELERTTREIAERTAMLKQEVEFYKEKAKALRNDRENILRELEKNQAVQNKIKLSQCNEAQIERCQIRTPMASGQKQIYKDSDEILQLRRKAEAAGQESQNLRNCSEKLKLKSSEARTEAEAMKKEAAILKLQALQAKQEAATIQEEAAILKLRAQQARKEANAAFLAIKSDPNKACDVPEEKILSYPAQPLPIFKTIRDKLITAGAKKVYLVGGDARFAFLKTFSTRLKRDNQGSDYRSIDLDIVGDMTDPQIRQCFPDHIISPSPPLPNGRGCVFTISPPLEYKNKKGIPTQVNIQIFQSGALINHNFPHDLIFDALPRDFLHTAIYMDDKTVYLPLVETKENLDKREVCLIEDAHISYAQDARRFLKGLREAALYHLQFASSFSEGIPVGLHYLQKFNSPQQIRALNSFLSDKVFSYRPKQTIKIFKLFKQYGVVDILFPNLIRRIGEKAIYTILENNRAIMDIYICFLYLKHQMKFNKNKNYFHDSSFFNKFLANLTNLEENALFRIFFEDYNNHFHSAASTNIPLNQLFSKVIEKYYWDHRAPPTYQPSLSHPGPGLCYSR